MKINLCAVVGILLLEIFSGSAGAEEKAASAREEVLRLRKEIGALVGPATCSNLVNCRVAALGVNACGSGATEYLAYSWLSTDKAAIETKLAEYDFALEDAQKFGAAPRVCIKGPEPVAACVNRRCVIPGDK
jgi:hypothetical protein